MPNRLAQTTSPYLLQHAGNPVDWYPWGEEALTKARTENKPIFLSIGYAACHWCHVMAHESFEDPETAALMNRHFVNIKVDREERPDLDAIYMQAVTAMTGSGGWPMSVFLTPDLRPFYGGTYFPPAARYNMPSFKNVLASLADDWQTRRDEIAKVGAHLAERLQSTAAWGGAGGEFHAGVTEAAAGSLIDAYDWAYGGWGAAPKFPQPMAVEVLLRLASNPFAKRRDEALKVIHHVLQAMSRGGMYDVVGGGFSRYSTDNHWRVPHFEKMLYDNAQLAQVYLHAWQLTGEPSYRHICEETLAFVARELADPEGGFYASLDADSEGVEGKFYVWTLEEIREQLSESSGFFEAAYGITERGNWEGRTVLQRALDDATLAARFGLDRGQVPAKLAECHSRLLSARSRRVRPATDDKVLTAWNGLMLAALAEAARALGSNDFSRFPDQATNHATEIAATNYYNLATRSADFLLTALRPDGRLRRAWRDGKTSGEVFLEDYAALILGLLELYQTDFDARWFAAAQGLAEEMIRQFSDPAGGFFDTPEDGEPLLVRPKDLQDNATPSGSALATEALLKLAACTENSDYRDRAEKSLARVAEAVTRYPTAFSRWLWAADFANARVDQVAISGDLSEPGTQLLLAEVRKGYRPRQVVAAAPFPPPEGSPALLHDRPMLHDAPTAYVCRGFVCQYPVTTPGELQKQLMGEF
ncbi:MAG: thioredoxin domain-containing protein [Chloroflexota bacterium]